MRPASAANGALRAAEYVGDGAFADFKPEQPFEHLHQAVVADHVAGMQIDRQRGDAGAEGLPGGMPAGGVPAICLPQCWQAPL